MMMIKRPKVDMRLRPVTDMEFKLYHEITSVPVDWANEHADQLRESVEKTGRPPEHLCKMVREAQRKVSHIGFEMTTAGLMIRDEPDLIDQEPELAAVALQEYKELLKRI